MSLSSLHRRTVFQRFKEEKYDLIIIGGGITGAGIALDAVTRGMRVALIEMQDFAAGTSSRSTKLVHGGLRYLKNLQFKVVAETGQERAIVYENGPHVTVPEKMLLPMHKGGTFGKFSTSIGLRLYDYLAKVKKSERRIMLNRDQVLKKEPLVKEQGLKGGGYYVEYRTDDARLTIEVLKKAVEYGADCLNYVKAEGFNYNERGKIEGVVVTDRVSGNTYVLEGHKVVNATGPWTLDVRDLTGVEHDKKLLLTKGVHLVFDQSVFPLKQAIYFDTEHDKRMIFAIPRGNKTYVGTTDTVYEDNKAEPHVSTADREYILEAIRYMFPSLILTPASIESSWAGIRPLIAEEGKSPSEISRKDEIWEDNNGLLTIAGGKLTGYRHMAEEIVDLVAQRLKEEQDLTFTPCKTKEEPISGGDVGGADLFETFVYGKVKEASQYNLNAEEAERLARFYGSNVDKLFEIAAKASPEAMHGLPLELYVRLIYGLTEEGVVTPADFFIRRTGGLFFDIDWVKEHKVEVLKFMARYFGWSPEKIKTYNGELERALYQATHPVEDPGVVKLEVKEDSGQEAQSEEGELTSKTEGQQLSSLDRADEIQREVDAIKAENRRKEAEFAVESGENRVL